MKKFLFMLITYSSLHYSIWGMDESPASAETPARLCKKLKIQIKAAGNAPVQTPCKPCPHGLEPLDLDTYRKAFSALVVINDQAEAAAAEKEKKEEEDKRLQDERYAEYERAVAQDRRQQELRHARFLLFFPSVAKNKSDVQPKVPAARVKRKPAIKPSESNFLQPISQAVLQKIKNKNHGQAIRS